MGKLQRVKIVDRIDITDQLAVFRMNPENPLQFRPGQCATLAVEDGEKFIYRPYSIASAPDEEILEFFIELVEDGQLTPRLWQMRSGDSLWMRTRAMGVFKLDTARKKHYFFATVTGVAPFLSMLRHEQKHRQGNSFKLIHGASHSADFGVYLEQLHALAREGWLEYIPTVSRPTIDIEWKGEKGRVDDVIRKYCDQWGYDDVTFYLCGHPGMVRNGAAILLRTGLAKDRIRQEEYFQQAEE
ncbi:MAG: FAD-binding oxidoreductase [Acidobacteriota bacterium]|nr:FAD-binding oxidoreductase [Blastocatellia bacterium]MDW8411805.1 FAD-binding oxidoreductase [Acidobacteriota bacterium]